MKQQMTLVSLLLISSCSGQQPSPSQISSSEPTAYINVTDPATGNLRNFFACEVEGQRLHHCAVTTCTEDVCTGSEGQRRSIVIPQRDDIDLAYSFEYQFPCYNGGRDPGMNISLMQGNYSQPLRPNTSDWVILPTNSLSGKHAILVSDSTPAFTANEFKVFFQSQKPCHLNFRYTATPSVAQVDLWNKDVKHLETSISRSMRSLTGYWKTKSFVDKYFEADDKGPVTSEIKAIISFLEFQDDPIMAIQAEALKKLVADQPMSAVLADFERIRMELEADRNIANDLVVNKLEPWHQTSGDVLKTLINRAKACLDFIGSTSQAAGANPCGAQS